MNILGLNAYHGDSSACLVVDGKLICAIEEERIRRIKHWAGLPTEAVKWCIGYAGIDIKDIDHIAISRDPSAHIHKKILRVLTRAPKLGFLKNRLQNVSRIGDIKEDIAGALGIEGAQIKAKVQNVEHHRAHIGSTFLVSPFDQALCVSVDGFGDFVSTMTGIGRGNTIEITDWVEFPHSLGVFYTALTQFLGFWKYGDEYKIMGLSALGEPEFLDEMKKIVRLKGDGLFDIDTSYFLHDKEGVDMVWESGEPAVGRLFSDRLADSLGKPREKGEELTARHQNIAASVQALYEEVFFHILNSMHKRHHIDKLTLTGGCIQNSLANGMIFDKTPFKEIYIPPASYDAGTAIGAAFSVWNVLLGKERSFVMDNPYWGPEYGATSISHELGTAEDELRKRGCKTAEIKDEEELCRRTAGAIAEGKIIGWFQGRTEWGPRALGNRSILVDPRRQEMKDILNERIKRREGFRPFAPSILEDFVSEWFENNYPVPFMEKVYTIKSDKRELIPAVAHADGTGRLQTVSRAMNPRYYTLIKEFNKLTGVPVVLNTSFNENEPIVNTPRDALNCFLRTKMDVLVLNNFYVSL